MSSASHPRTSFLERAESHTDFDINIAPIVDCFTVLIAYLLVSASFLSFKVIDVGVTLPSTAKRPTGADAGPLHVKIELRKDGTIQLNTSGAETRQIEVPTLGVLRNYDVLAAEMKDLKARAPTGEATAVVWAERSVEYGELVTALETVKAVIPTVFIGESKTD